MSRPGLMLGTYQASAPDFHSLKGLSSHLIKTVCANVCCHGAVAQLVEALRYEAEGLSFDSRWYNYNFSTT
jgi:hypothetical protein